MPCSSVLKPSNLDGAKCSQRDEDRASAWNHVTKTSGIGAAEVRQVTASHWLSTPLYFIKLAGAGQK
jgi:hypothetical protein